MKQLPAPTAEDITTAEVDAIRELRSHPGYQLHTNRVVDMILRKQNDLELDRTPDQTARLRGYIAALRDVLTIPEVLMKELEAQLKGTT